MIEEPFVLIDPETVRQVRNGRRRRVATVVGALVAGAVLVGVTLTSRASEPTVVARRGDILYSLSAVGRIESERTIECVPKIVARIQKIHVQEGEAVEAGQTLVTLEREILLAQCEEAVQVRAGAKARWDELVRGARPEELDEAEARVDEAEQAVSRFRSIHAKGRDAAVARLSIARAEAEYASKQWARLARLLDGGVITELQVDEAKRNHEASEAALRQAAADYERLLKGLKGDQKDEGSADLDAAKARLNQARAARARLVNGATLEEKQRAEAEFRKAEAVIARIRGELAETILTAPFRGVVARRYKEPSELAYPEMPVPILVLADRERIARVEILESDIYKVELGRSAVVTSDSYPGRSWGGKVTRISPVLGRKRIFTENPKEKTDVKVLEVKITLEEWPDLPLSLPVEAKIFEPRRMGVIVIPVRALLPGGEVGLPGGARRGIRPGLRDDAFVEILSGLSEGDRITLPP